MSAPDTAPPSDFRARAKANDVAVARLIGFQCVTAAGGRGVVTLAAGPQHANPMGTLHGGILCDIADAAMGMAFASTLAEGESFTTIELKMNFFRPVWERATHRGCQSNSSWQQNRLHRMRSHRRNRPLGCQIRFYLHGAGWRTRQRPLSAPLLRGNLCPVSESYTLQGQLRPRGPRAHPSTSL